MAVALSRLSLRTFRSKGDLVASLPHVALYHFSAGQNPELAPLTSGDQLLQSCVFFRYRGVVPSTRPSDPARAGRVGARAGQEVVTPTRLWDTGARQQNGQRLLVREKNVHLARTQADTHTPGRAAVWRARACKRRLFTDCETLVLMIFRQVQCDHSVEFSTQPAM